MKEMESFEQAMSQWKPRRPSARVAQQLFGKAENRETMANRHPVSGLRRAEFWNWLTPVAACAFTILVAVGSTVHRADTYGVRSAPVFFAGLIANPIASNSPQMVELTAMDENVQWNAYPEMARVTEKRNGQALGTNLNRTF